MQIWMQKQTKIVNINKRNLQVGTYWHIHAQEVRICMIKTFSDHMGLKTWQTMKKKCHDNAKKKPFFVLGSHF